MSQMSSNGFSSLIPLEAHWDMKFMLFLWAWYQCLISSLQILPCFFAALYEPAQPKGGIWHCSGLLLAAGESLVSVELSAQWCTGLCSTQARYSDPPGSLTGLISPKPSTSMAPPAPKSLRQDSNILQPVKGHLSNAWADLYLLNGKVLKILGNKSTIEKDRSTPKILSITALVNWEMVSQPVGSCGKILWVFK